MALADQVLDYTKNGELVFLQQAWATGLVSDAKAHAILADIDKRFADELAGYPKHVWSFAEKKVKDRDKPDDIWDPS